MNEYTTVEGCYYRWMGCYRRLQDRLSWLDSTPDHLADREAEKVRTLRLARLAHRWVMRARDYLEEHAGS